jgi:hypothetical protein
MKKFYALVIIGAILLVAPTVSFSKDPVHVDILYMNHGPMQPTLRELRALFPKYGEQVVVGWYDFESDAGERFKAKMGVSHHTPLTIWVDGQSELKHADKTIKIEGFPTGSGPAFFQGKWKVEDLADILDLMTGQVAD